MQYTYKRYMSCTLIFEHAQFCLMFHVYICLYWMNPDSGIEHIRMRTRDVHRLQKQQNPKSPHAILELLLHFTLLQVYKLSPFHILAKSIADDLETSR